MKHISVYDFDGTLFKTIEKNPENLDIWKQKNLNKPFGSGWWANPNSLCLDTYEIKPIEHVKDDLLKKILDLDTYTVLLTGRIERCQKAVKEILRVNNIPYLDAYYFNNSHRTLDFKLSILTELKQMFPEVEKMEMWEDREEHIPHFEEWGKENYGSNFTLHIVK